MTIVVRRGQGWFARLRRIRLRLDGVTVARVGPGRSAELTGSGGPQRLTASIDWAGSNELVVTDPGPGAAVVFDLTARGSLAGLVRTFVAPNTLLVLVPAGAPVPPPPPLRPRWRRVALFWLILVLLQAGGAGLVQGLNGNFDPAGLAARMLGVGAGYAIAIGVVILLVRRSSR